MNKLFNKLILLSVVVMLLFSLSTAHSSEPDWKAFSKNIVKALKSDNTGLKQSAMQMIIRHGNKLEIGQAVFEIMRVFRNEKDQKKRRLALTALANSENKIVQNLLKRRIDFENDPVIKKQLVDLNNYKTMNNSKESLSLANSDFIKLSHKIEKLDAEEKLYTLEADLSGNLLNSGQNNYIIHFNKLELPPVESFWAVTLYDSKTHLPFENNKEESTIKSSQLTRNADGSLTVYVQYNSPAVNKKSNWLPAPDGAFYLDMRLYKPGKEAIAGHWNPPQVKAQSLSAK